MERRQDYINLIASIISFCINIGINFLLTPFIVKKLGNVAYGYIGLSINFISYATVITIALNSVASRFVTISLHKKDEIGANIYFNSVLIANIITAIILSIISVITVINIERILIIPEYLVNDVKVTFALVFANFIITVITAVFSISIFVKNRIDLLSIITLKANFIRVVLLILLFYFLKAKLFYIGISGLVMTLYGVLFNIKYTKKLLPKIKIKFKSFKLKAVTELFSLGVWNSVNNLSQILLTGLDLWIANLMIGSQAMGILSIAKSLPNIIVSFLETIASTYSPKFTILYAEGKLDELVNEIKLSIRTLGLIITVPLSGFIVFGIDFYKLWLPTLSYEEILEIQILSILTLGPIFISAFIYSLYSVNIITNKLKIPTLLTLGISIISTIGVFIILKTTNLGVYSIAGVSSMLLILRVVFFEPVYAARSLRIRLTTFYPPMLKGILSFIIITIIFLGVKNVVIINSWKIFALVVGILGTSGYIINFFIVLKKKERLNLIRRMKFIGYLKRRILNG